jgi:hypothetical protein
MKPRRPSREEAMMELLRPFVPLLVKPSETELLTQASKRFYLDGKEYEYVPGVGGHVPVWRLKKDKK